MPGLVRGVARTAAIAGTATAVSNRVSRRQADRWASQDQQQAYEQAPPPPPQAAPAPTQVVYAAPPPPPPGPDMDTKLAQLQQLAELKTQGVLSETEFEIQKQRILNS
jgi:putative oligomerization/nucleic acid binding protein